MPLPLPPDPGTTALHTATYKGHLSVVEALIAANADVHPRCPDGVTPLLMAAKSGKTDLVRMLVQAQADVNASLHDGGTSLLAAAYKGHVDCVAVRDRPDASPRHLDDTLMTGATDGCLAITSPNTGAHAQQAYQQRHERSSSHTFDAPLEPEHRYFCRLQRPSTRRALMAGMTDTTRRLRVDRTSRSMSCSAL